MDGLLRVLLAMSVVYMHHGRLGETALLYGTSVVIGFFIISGFYMSLVLSGQYSGAGGARAFYLNRAFRIFPIYLVVLVATVVSMPFVDGNIYMTNEDYLASLGEASFMQQAFAIAPNVLLLGQDFQFQFRFEGGGIGFAPTIDIANYLHPFQFLLAPQAWSIALELYFYALAPLFARWRTHYLVLLVLASFGLRAVLLAQGAAFDPWLYRFFPTTLGFFVLGMLSHRAYVRFAPFWEDRRVAITCFAILVAVPLGYTWWAPVAHAIAPALWPDGHLFLYVAPFVLPGVFASSKNWKWDRAIGELSYPIYMAHILVYMWMRHVSGVDGQWVGLPSIWHVLAYDAIVVLAAVALLVFVDRPIDRWRHAKTAEWRAGGRGSAPAAA